MSNEFFAGFHPPHPPPGLRERVLQAARTAGARAPSRPLVGRVEWALVAAALALAITHLVLPSTSASPWPAAPAPGQVTSITGDPTVDALLVAEADRWEKDHHRRLLVELGFPEMTWEGRSRK